MRIPEAYPDTPGAVIVLREGQGGGYRIIPGRRGSTAPRWLLKAVTDTLRREGLPYVIDPPHPPLFRLGWLAEDPDITLGVPQGIPGLLLEVPQGAPELLSSLGKAVEGVRVDGSLPSEWDRHYLVLRWGNLLFLPGEETLVTAAILLSLAAFFVLFFFSFTYGSKSEQHLRDFLRVWWLPFFFLAVTLGSLYAGQNLARLVMTWNYGSPEGWIVAPARALAVKLAFAFFFTSLLVTLNQLIPFPREGFVYGYIANLSCLANLFIFASLDFSLILVFSLACLAAFALYHLRNPWVQAAGLTVLALPFLPYLTALSRGDALTIDPVYNGSFLWNFRIAAFVMPFQLFMTRLTHSVGVIRGKRGLHIPLLPVTALGLGIAVTVLTFLVPPWTPERPLKVRILQSLDRRGLTTTLDSPVINREFPLVMKGNTEGFPAVEAVPEELLGVSVELRRVLGRTIARVSIDPEIPMDAYRLSVYAEGETAILASSLDYRRSPSGDRADFTIPASAQDQVSLEFTSAATGALILEIHGDTSHNPWEVSIDDPAVEGEYRLTVGRTYRLRDGNVEEGAE